MKKMITIITIIVVIILAALNASQTAARNTSAEDHLFEFLYAITYHNNFASTISDDTNILFVVDGSWQYVDWSGCVFPWPCSDHLPGIDDLTAGYEHVTIEIRETDLGRELWQHTFYNEIYSHGSIYDYEEMTLVGISHVDTKVKFIYIDDTYYFALPLVVNGE